MNRRNLIRHLEAHGCQRLREGGKQSLNVNASANVSSDLPRHSEINDFLAGKICRDLEVPPVP